MQDVENDGTLMMLERTTLGAYRKTHPFITFDLDLSKCSPRVWIGLGEARSKCEHLAGVALKPATAEYLHKLYLAKGAHATAAIEGNTLSEAQVLERMAGGSTVPQSQKYLETEIDNVLELSQLIMDQVEERGELPITVADIKEYNRIVLQNLETDDHVLPGEFRETTVGVMDYRAPDCRDCDYLMERLCQWLNTGFKTDRPDEVMVYGIIKSVVAHIYLAWIHAFGDGNGRTARAVEVRFLMEAGVPSSAIHLLSNHYNQTRSEYYRQLSRASKNGGDLREWIGYSIEGLVDQLRGQLKIVKFHQWRVAWENYVYELYGNNKTAAEKRQIKLVLALSDIGKSVPRSELRRLTPELAEEYAGKTAKTLSRDINSLEMEDLIVRDGSSIRAHPEKILAFLPRMRKGDFEAQLKMGAIELFDED